YNEGVIDAEYELDTSMIYAAGIGINNANEAVEYALLFNEGGFDYDTSAFDAPGATVEMEFGTELFFSEYIEGSGYYDKALEIYNPTNAAINLSGYSIQYFSGSRTTANATYNLSGTINPGDVYVIAHSSAATAIRNVADATTTGIMAFSGDDSLSLLNGSTVIDSIGQRGYDPGTAYTASGVSTINMTLVRKPSILTGRTDYSSIFDPSIEWIGYANGTYSLLGSHRVNHRLIFKYASTIYDIGSSPVTLSRVYNRADLTYDSSYYTDISPLYRSLNDNPTVIQYSSNYGDTNYYKFDSGFVELTLKNNLNISGITTDSDVNFRNVNNYGAINVIALDLDIYTLNVAGITNTLSEDHYLIHSLNQGTIKVAEIDSSTSGSPNIYIGGLVNNNLAGDLHDLEQDPNYPVATVGIIDSMNYGNILTEYDSTHQGILGKSNTFAAGIATLNAGSIQDSANLGLVSIYNASSSGTTSLSSDNYTAARVLSYTHGVTTGGIVAIVMNGNSRVYDTANNGDIIAVSYRYSRSGGIIATALYSEGGAGGVIGLVDDIGSSQIKNGINFGSVTAITSINGSYSSTAYNTTITTLRYGSGDPLGGTTGCGVYPNTTVGSNDRPGVYAAAGGVVGYGLSVMKNMLNHGTISGTDVAGGIVGATYVEGAETPKTTIVDINTAINYGEIKAISTASFGSIVTLSLIITNIDDFYLPDGNSTIFPSVMDVFFPGTKRGFGGIFGRLQRGVRGIMSTTGGSFDFIVNTNPEVDLVGRLDQDYAFSNSARYFQFYDTIIYSARYEDTTQAVFTGFYYGELQITAVSGSSAPYTYTATINNIYKQVGTVATLDSSPGTTGYVFTSSTSLSVGNTTLRFLERLDVPWITEDPLDPLLVDSDTENMYDEDFEMRVNSDLTKYIYYMEKDLLATRFQTSRPNGMYVLSTTAGSTYGRVLPTNIDITKMRTMNEESETQISLLIDYTAVGSDHTNAIPPAVEAKYLELKQTIFNDKAELVPSDSILLKLEETTSNHSILLGGDIDYLARTIDFTISMEAFLTGNTTVSYEVTEALISANALIARRAEDYFGHAPSTAELEAYRYLLFQEGADFVSETYAPTLSLTLPDKDISPLEIVTLPLGYFTVYSEAFVGNDLFASSNYYRDYLVRITFTPGIAYAGGDTGLTDVAFNGGMLIDATGSPTDIQSLGTVDATGSLRLVFTDENDIFLEGYDFKEYFALKYFDPLTSTYIAVPSEHYTIAFIPTIVGDTSAVYEITFSFKNTLRQGIYQFEYRYFPGSTLLTLVFDKNPSGVAEIIDFTYYSELNSLAIDGLAIDSLINMGSPVTIDTNTSNFTSSEQTGLDPFLSNYIYNLSYTTAGTFVISPFAIVSSARLVEITYLNGYKDYEIEIIIVAEDATTSSTYTHHLVERPVDLVSVLKNGNETDLNDVFAMREDQSTLFTVDLGFDQTLDLYNLTVGLDSYLQVTVTATLLDEVTVIDSEDIVGLSYNDEGDYLDITMEYDTIPGIYTFEFYFYRDGSANYITLATPLVIKKLQGVSPYLTDIRFSLLANETSYPEIYTINDNPTFDYTLVTINALYNPAVYFAGIDYAGADLAGVQYFRVDGKVSKVPLEQYMPYMVDYLPYGATIARYDYDDVLETWQWTAEVGENASSEEIAVLITNFTEFPDTHLEPSDEENVLILYRVTSEDGNHFAYYFVTVTDVEFNTSMIFNLYFCSSADPASCKLAKQVDSGFNDQMVIVTVKNFITDGDDTILGVTDPEDYPGFTEIMSLKSKMTQFIYTNADNYAYGFGRNRSGFFTFDVELPLDPYLNELYTYDIEYDIYTLNDASDYVEELDGKYFY
ncbi:MAG: lamin tail domain-containing protein, partial [Candidatus Izemoplasmatales bacterium]|nr:lamin tail domain-containing protein [Candidatus Izemoplasmatales bacterium]